MVEIISGGKGKGKTRHLIDKAHEALKVADGNIIYVDKNSKHMYELDNKIRLIDTGEFPLESSDEFLGFLSGMMSQNSDIEEIYLDSFLDIGFIDTADGLVRSVEKLDAISDKFNVKFVLSVAKDKDELPDDLQTRVIVAL